SNKNRVQRISANAFETLVEELVRRWLPHADQPLGIPLFIRFREDGLLLDMPGELAAEIAAGLSTAETIIHSSRVACRIAVALALPLRGGKRLIVDGTRTSHPDPVLIAALRKAHAMTTRSRGLPIIATAPPSRYERELLRLAILEPDLQRDILTGH